MVTSNLFPNLEQNTPANGGSKTKALITWKGLNIGIEYQPGDARHNRIMQVSYGHIQGYVGADKDALDVYLGNKPASNRIFQIDQLKADGSAFDEHKFMLWFATPEEALSAYLGQMPRQFYGGMKEIKLAELNKYKKK